MSSVQSHLLVQFGLSLWLWFRLDWLRRLDWFDRFVDVHGLLRTGDFSGRIGFDRRSSDAGEKGCARVSRTFQVGFLLGQEAVISKTLTQSMITHAICFSLTPGGPLLLILASSCSPGALAAVATGFGPGLTVFFGGAGVDCTGAV